MYDLNLETKLLLNLEKHRISIFSIDDAKKFLKTSASSVSHVLNRLVHKGRVQRIKRGLYMLIPARAGVERMWTEYPWPVLPKLLDTYYVGFLTAMNFWGMTEQIPNTVFIVTTERKQNFEFDHQRFRFITLHKKKFFGFIKQNFEKNTEFNISSREKTIVDGLAHPEYCGGIVEVTKAIWNARDEADWNLVLEMAERIEINVVLKRLGYLLSVLDIQKEIAEKIKSKINLMPYQLLDPIYDKKTIVPNEYGLITNLTNEELVCWMDY